MPGGEPPSTPKEVKKYLQQSHDRIFENNKKWAAEQKAKHPEFFEKLTQGQSPDYLWIGMQFLASLSPNCASFPHDLG
jgi:carbonic anhydrase